MVLAWHTSDHVGYRLPVFGSAAIAVDVFMNVSGFLMIFHYWERREKEPWAEPTTWWRFYVRRFFRISPLYYFLLLVLVTVKLTPSASMAGAGLPTWQWLLLRLSYVFGFLPHESTNCAMPDWSLSLEMQYYACFPFLALAMNRLGAGLFFFLCALMGALCRFSVGYYNDAASGLWLYFDQPSILPVKLQTFAVGMVMAWVLVRGTQELKSKWFWAAVPVYLLTCKENFLWLLAAIYSAGYVACLVPPLRARFFGLMRISDQMLRKLPLRKTLADCSYGTYLIHNIVIGLVLVKIWPALPKGQGALVQFLPAFMLNLGLTTLLSYLLDLAIGRPGINWGKTIIRRFATGHPGATGGRAG
jgi:peptidoglycan/LPS O-acetylase OafA/YrhL